MRLELIYGEEEINGTIERTINGHRINYFSGSNSPAIEENEYIIDDEQDIKKLTEWLISHPDAKTIDKKKCKLNLCVSMKELKEKISKDKKPTLDDLKAIQTLERGVNRNMSLEVKDNGETIIHNLRQNGSI